VTKGPGVPGVKNEGFGKRDERNGVLHQNQEKQGKAGKGQRQVRRLARKTSNT